MKDDGNEFDDNRHDDERDDERELIYAGGGGGEYDNTAFYQDPDDEPDDDDGDADNDQPTGENPNGDKPDGGKQGDADPDGDLPEREKGMDGAIDSDSLAAFGKQEVIFNPSLPIEVFYRSICAILAQLGRFFSMNGRLVEVSQEYGLRHIDSRNFNAHVSRFLEVKVEGKDGSQYKLQPSTLINPLLVSPERIAGYFPPLETYSEIPYVTADFEIVHMPGYDAQRRVYYRGPTIEPKAQADLLGVLLAGFHWKSPVDMVNFIGLLLSGLIAHLFRGRRPIGVISGNKPGVGKSRLADVLGVVLDGDTPRTISYHKNDEEFEKQLGTSVARGNRVLVIDNVRASGSEIRSESLERSSTAAHLNYRRVGTSTAIEEPNDVTFAFTMNRAVLNPDLSRRSLPMHLQFEGDVRTHEYPIPNIVAYAKENRWEIVAELLGMIQAFVDAGRVRPTNAARHSVCQEWAATTDGILRQSGFHGFLSNFTESQAAFAPRYAIVAGICEALNAEPAGTPAEWLERIIENPVVTQFGSAFLERGKRGQQTIVGTLFNEFRDQEFHAGDQRMALRMCATTNGNTSKTYWFEALESDSTGSV